ncbi:MAG: hypothetical protein KC800_31445 [Candidatus Eremiobacteraeota bacterium]|nr:hypothetical protein [Candidatus Eremiobacteraeota bacterium]
MAGSLSSYHAGLFRWHCLHFFDFESALSKEEQKYLRKCWSLCRSYQEVSDGGYRHFSYYSYSHRVKGDSVNSSRLAYGSVIHSTPAFRAAGRVLNHRGLSLPESLTHRNKFYGLGWDFEKEQFKVYFRTLNWQRLEPPFLDLAKGYRADEHRPEALISVTYTRKEVVESKLYLYPLDHLLPNGVRGFARMITDRRGEVSQEDLDPKEVAAHQFNAKGREIIKAYEEIGESLDTVAYQSAEDFTLYFP